MTLIDEFSDPELYTDTQETLIELLAKRGTMTRKELMDESGTPWTTCYDNLEKLEGRGIVKRFDIHNQKRGRPKVGWRLTEE